MERAPGRMPQLPMEAFAARRERLADALGESTLIVGTHAEALYANDVHHRFRPQSDFWYLTGFQEPGAVCVIEGETAKTTLFLRNRKPDAEIWTGRRLGVERAADALGVDAALDIEELGAKLPEVMHGAPRAIIDHDPACAEIVRNVIGKTEPAAGLTAELRVRKDAAELELLRAAARVGNEAHVAAARLARAGRWEYELEAALLQSFRAAGSTGPGYPPIVGAGANAAVLHYIDNAARVAAGDLVLVDAGCEWGYYNSDITRTLPADGAWSNDDRRVYDLVAAAQKAAIGATRPGATFRAPHDAAVRVLCEGLADLGWIDDPEPPAKDPADAPHRRFYMHGTSHFLGLDVHDAGSTKGPDGESRRLEPGMVLTIEPGLYLNPDYTVLPAGARPMGIRIENDVIVTEDGCEDLQADLPTDADAVADLVRDA